MRAKDVMVRAVATTTRDATVETVAKLMINLRISGVPVLDRNGQLVGIVTEGDLLRRVETGTDHRRSRWSQWFSGNAPLAADYIKAHARRVEDVMTRKVVTVEELAGLDEVAELMESNGIKRVPVVHDGKIVGADLLQMLASGGAPTEAEDSDRVIRGRLLAELDMQEWASEPERIEYRRLGRGRAFLGHRPLGGVENGAARPGRKHPRRRRHRGSHDLRPAVSGAAVSGSLKAAKREPITRGNG